MTGLPYRNGVRTITAVSNDRVETVTSTASRMSNYGKTLLNKNSTAAKTFILEAPVPGVRKVIVQTSTSTFVNTINGPTTTVLFSNTTPGNTALAFDTVGDLIELEGRTNLIWDVVYVNSVSLS